MRGSWALITGASSGIGWAIAEAFAERGVNLLVAARRAERLDQLKDELVGRCGVRVEPMVFDVRDRQACEEALRQHDALVRQVAILVNNAGLAKGTDPMPSASVADWEQMIDTNVKGLLYVSRYVLPHMVERNDGHVVNVGSVGGRWVAPGGAVYCATKFAVRALTDGLRMDLMGKRIRVTNVEPGAVETEFSLVRTGDAEKSKAFYGGFTPLRARDVAEAVVWCVERPPHVNVHELVIFPTDQVGVGPAYLHRKQ